MGDDTEAERLRNELGQERARRREAEEALAGEQRAREAGIAAELTHIFVGSHMTVEEMTDWNERFTAWVDEQVEAAVEAAGVRRGPRGMAIRTANIEGSAGRRPGQNGG